MPRLSEFSSELTIPGIASRLRWNALAAALLLAALWAVHHVLGGVHWPDVLAHLRNVPGSALLLALLLTFASYLVLVLYDVLAVHAAGATLRWREILLTAFPAAAIGNTVGFAALSGGAIRMRWYLRAGLTGGQVTRVIGFATLTFALGAALLCGLSLTVGAVHAGRVLGTGTVGALLLGLLLLGAVAGYCGLAALRRAPLQLLRASVPMPGLAVAMGQLLVASADLLLAAAVLYVLLPEGSTHGFVPFLSLYLLALVAGVLSGVPGGVGVFEAVLLVLLPEGSGEQKLAALLGFRFVYYLLPFALAVLLVTAREAWNARAALRRGLDWSRAWLRALVPQFASAVVFVGGLLLLFSSVTPGVEGRLAALRKLLPLSLVEVSHLVGSVVGIALLLLAQGLQRRLDAAWHVTMLLLSLGVVASLAKGLDFEEAALLLLLALLLWLVRDRFSRKASLLEQRFSPGWMVAMLAALLSSLCLAWLSYRNVEWSSEMWWHFAFHADAPRALRAMVLTVVLTGLVAAWLLLRPAPHRPALPDAAQLERARSVIAASPDTVAWLALLADKNLLFSADGSGFVMYRPVARNWIAMGEPVGPPEVRRELIWKFREACDRYAARPVFYQVGVEDLPAYIEAGFVLSKIGEEARVPLAHFDLEGSRRAELRQGVRRAQRDGLRFQVLDATQVPRHIEALRQVSDDWLGALSVAEKGFSLGRFDPDYLANFPCAVIWHEDAIVAFCNLWCGAGKAELSVDLMRHLGTAPKGVMDYLMIELMRWGREQGYSWFSLGMAPLAGLSEREYSPLWNRVGGFLYHHGEHFYNFEGLRAYKQKFQPVWRPRYLATTGQLALPRAVMDVASLIAGGSRRLVMR